MKLFLITDEFNKSTLERSFRATVIAKEENSARWLVGQRSRAFQISDVAAASVFCIGELTTEEEGVLTIVHDNGALQLAASQLAPPRYKEETYFEVNILDNSILSRRDQTFRSEKWFAPKGEPDYLLQRVELSIKEKVGKVERRVFVQQMISVDAKRRDQWSYVNLGEPYKTQVADVHQSSLLELRSIILRTASTLPVGQCGEQELSKLWSFVSESNSDGAVPVDDFSFYPGQKLFWRATEARLWVSKLPQIVSVDFYIDADLVMDVPGTNCQTY